ncbi:MAG TPA: hypothetical protein DCG04_15880, partial [Rhodospirillaceae bacterium]|nr:hypothetical protein [Rhodospirillaceae bacterium]
MFSLHLSGVQRNSENTHAKSNEFHLNGGSSSPRLSHSAALEVFMESKGNVTRKQAPSPGIWGSNSR